MGICYTLLLYDEWNWGYQDKSKEEALKAFEDEWPGYSKRLAEWSDFAVYDVDKAHMYSEEWIEVIAKYAEKAYFYGDSSTYDLQTLDLSEAKKKLYPSIGDTIEASRDRAKQFPTMEDVDNKLKEILASK